MLRLKSLTQRSGVPRRRSTRCNTRRVPSGDKRGQLYAPRSDKMRTSLPSRSADMRRVVRTKDLTANASVCWDPPIAAS